MPFYVGAGLAPALDRAVGNMMNMVGISISEAVTMASTKPAAVPGLENRKGRLEEGYEADIAVLDRTYRAVLTVVGGQVVYDALTTAP